MRGLSPAVRAWAAAGLLAGSVSGCGGGGGGIDAYWVGTQVASADLDGDGLAEVITLSTRIESFERQIGHLKVYRQTAPGVFAAPMDHVLARYPWRFALGDLDGDGHPDLVVTHPDLTQLSWLRQDPARPGEFLAPVMLDAAAGAYTVALGDFDGDARLDIVASGQPMQLLRQDPTQSGRFLAPQPLDAGHGVFEVAAADLDGDGRFDLAAGGGERVSVLLQTDDGFAAPRPVASTAGGGSVDHLAAADLDGDGRSDLMFVYGPNDEGDVLASEVGLLLRDGAGDLFQPLVRTGAAHAGLSAAALGDLNGDGLIDLARGGFWPEGAGAVRQQVIVQRQLAPPALQLEATIDMPAAIAPVAIADVTGDGRPDVLALGGDTVWALPQRATAFSFDAVRPLR
ncbi:VCBS repeat-containing protein [uncultured Piscinibacter sp.]|mgnify:CR=1 FL=1|uniref:FG-GAP repeat domain-containing protein n=1 Tax=uncultured Piscinibacter sp. TaxID=1131835 RepID=UPI002639D2CC|nr:VCBS repeat-containing protein [uncultured Piscinibacter sp.]